MKFELPKGIETFIFQSAMANLIKIQAEGGSFYTSDESLELKFNKEEDEWEIHNLINKEAKPIRALLPTVMSMAIINQTIKLGAKIAETGKSDKIERTLKFINKLKSGVEISKEDQKQIADDIMDVSDVMGGGSVINQLVETLASQNSNQPQNEEVYRIEIINEDGTTPSPRESINRVLKILEARLAGNEPEVDGAKETGEIPPESVLEAMRDDALNKLKSLEPEKAPDFFPPEWEIDES